MKKLLIAFAALGCAAFAFAATGARHDMEIASPTGGVAVARCAAGDVVRLDFATDSAAKIELVRAIAGQTISTATLTNAASACVGTVAGVGVVGSGDYFRLTATTNATAFIYTISK